MLRRKSLNYKILFFFAPVLILIGVSGFILPAESSLTSGEPVYNIFHIVSGSIGLSLVIARYEIPIRAFNIGFGLIDIYQFFASREHLFPERFFKWTPTDDILHVVIGVILLLAGLYAFIPRRKTF